MFADGEIANDNYFPQIHSYACYGFKRGLTLELYIEYILGHCIHAFEFKIDYIYFVSFLY